MVYVAYDPKDDFWLQNSKVIFSGESWNHLVRMIGTVSSTNVEIWETNLPASDSVLYYTGHGKKTSGMPLMLHNVQLFVQFIIDYKINVNRIVFLSCHTFNWLCGHYKEFIGLLSGHNPTIQIEGSRDSLLMRHIHPIVKKQINTTNISFEAIRLTRDEEKSKDMLIVEGINKKHIMTKPIIYEERNMNVWITARESDFQTEKYKISV